MTICGLSVGPNDAFTWTDTECYVNGEPFDHHTKLVISPTSNTAMVGTGRLFVCRAAGAVVLDHLTLDATADALPEKLLRSAADNRDTKWMEKPMMTSIGLCGFSHRLGRLVGIVFLEREGYEPRLISSWGSPALQSAPHDRDGAIEAGLSQWSTFRDGNNSAKAGVLTLAHVTTRQIIAGPVADLATGKLISKPQAAQ